MPKINQIIPLLVYEDIPAAHEFLVNVFGFTPGGIERNAEDQPVHAEVYAGNLTIWIHRVTQEHGLVSQGSLQAASSGLFIIVDNVDAHYEHARTHGANIEKEPKDESYGYREYGVRDPEGNRWWFGTPLKQPQNA